MPTATTSPTRTAAREILQAIPEQNVVDGGRVDWGPEGTKARALYVAALNGHHFDPKCVSCESDLWRVLKWLSK